MEDATNRDDDQRQVVVRGHQPFDSFYRREFRQVLTLVSVLSGSRMAEDFAQEAFTRAYRSWDRVGTMENPDAWVRVVAMNLARSAFRRTKAEGRAMLRLGHPATELPALEADAHSFWQEVRRLPRRQAQVIALHYLEDRPVAEIASILDVAENTVKVQLRNGRKSLASRLGLEEES